jgi:hypothetical protein
MAIAISTRGKPAKSGGGGLGKLLGLGAGALIGGIATAATGGAAAPVTAGMIAKSALAGAGTGSMLGGLAGEALSPGQAAQQSKGPQLDNNQAMERRAQLLESQQKLKTLRDAAVSLPQVDAGVRSESAEPIFSAYKTEAEKLRRFG